MSLKHKFIIAESNLEKSDNEEILELVENDKYIITVICIFGRWNDCRNSLI